MVYIEYCDKCKRQIAGWDNEYGQVMSITLDISSDSRNNGIIDGKTSFCSAKCAVEYLKSYIKSEEHWIDVWKRGKILGEAPCMPVKKTRRE